MKNERIYKTITIFTIISVIVTLINLAYSFLLPIYLSYKFQIDLREASSIGIIGGADGPTSIYLSSQQSPHIITAIFALLSIIGIIYILFHKRDKR